MASNVSQSLISDVLDVINIDDVEKNVREGKVDVNALLATLSSILSKDDLNKLVENAEKMAASMKKDEALTKDNIMQVLKGVTTDKKIQRKVLGGDINIDKLKEALTSIVGEDAQKALIEEANKIAATNIEKNKDVA